MMEMQTKTEPMEQETVDCEACETETADSPAAEAVAPVWQGASTADKLGYAAEVYGMPEEALVEALLQQSGDDGAGFEAFAAAKKQQNDEAVDARLVREFDELTAQVPDIRQVQDIPEAVVACAVRGEMSLTDAYLRYWYRVSRESERQKAAERQAADLTAGRMGGEFCERDPKETAFSRAFQKAIS